MKMTMTARWDSMSATSRWCVVLPSVSAFGIASVFCTSRTYTLQASRQANWGLMWIRHRSLFEFRHCRRAMSVPHISLHAGSIQGCSFLIWSLRSAQA